MLIGKAGCGKTSFLDSLCYKKPNLTRLLSESSKINTYSETPGKNLSTQLFIF